MRRIHGAHIFGGIVFSLMLTGVLLHLFPSVYERGGMAFYYLQIAVLSYGIYRALGWAERSIVGR
jgi:hypothetical protein